MVIGTTPRLSLAALLLAAGAAAQNVVTLEQAAARSGRDFAAVQEGRTVVVRGQIASPPFSALGTYYVSLRDRTDHGLLLRVDAEQLAGLRSGEWIEARGVIQSRAGLPMLVPATARKVASGAAPAPKELTIAEVSSLRYLGLLVRTRATVTGIGENLGGQVLEVNDHGNSIAAFLPHTPNSAGRELGRIRAGDRVRLTGLATQYSPEPPYDGSFQIMLGSPDDVEVLEGGSALPPYFLVSAFAALVLLLTVWWIYERRTSAQRKTMRTLHGLSEAVIAARAPVEMAEKLDSVLPTVTQATGVRLYLFNRRDKTLECVRTTGYPDPIVVPIDSPPGGLAGAAVACFGNRKMLSVPDVRRSPYAKAGGKTTQPRSAMFIPLFAQNDILGVLEVDNSHQPGYLTPEEQAVAQHLANQAAASLKLQEQQVMREQMLHSEKLAATGQLISDVASDLRAPLENIVQLTGTLEQNNGAPVPERQLRELVSESLRASDIVSRLVSLAQPEDSTPQQVDVNAVAASLMQFREPEWKPLGLRVQNRLAPAPALVLGTQGKIEQVLLNLLVHAEQCASETPVKTISVSSHTIGRRAVVELSYSMVAGGEKVVDPFLEGGSGENGTRGLSQCPGIIQSHGGEIRFRAHQGTATFIVDLPLVRGAGDMTSSEIRRASSPLTVMLVDSDAAGRRQLFGLLSLRGHRVVPVPLEEAADLCQRFRFDAVMWAIRPGGSRWGEFHERIRAHANAFVLVSDGYDPELARSLEESAGFLLGRPVKESELDAILAKIAALVPHES